jgi:hypothetical protein
LSELRENMGGGVAAPPLSSSGLSSYAAAMTAFALLAGMVAGMVSLPASRPVASAFTPEHVALLGMVDNAPARLAFQVALASLAGFGLCGILAIPRCRTGSSLPLHALEKTGRLCKKILPFAIVGGVAFVVGSRSQGMGFNAAQGWKLSLAFVLASTAAAAVGLLFARWSGSRGVVFGVCACLAAYALALTVPGLLRPIFLSGPLLEFTEWHYSVTLAQGDRLAAGLPLGETVLLNYGLIPSLALAIAERAGGFLDFREHIRLVQWSQVAFLAVALTAFALWQPRAPLFWLLAALLVGPWVSTSHIAVFHPNQAGWRSLGFAVGLTALLLARRSPLRRAVPILGSAAAFLVLYNPETGICLAFGFVLFLLSRARPPLEFRTVARGVAYAVAAAAATTFAVLAVYRAGLGHWPPLAPAAYLGFITRFGQGYGSLPLHFDPLALLIFGHSMYLVAAFTLRWRVRPLRLRESVLLAIAATSLLWFAYYVNRPAAWNLWTFLFLYSFLLADFLDLRTLLRLRRRRLRAALDVRVLVVGLVALPAALSINFHFFRTPWPSPGPGAKVATFSGVRLPEGTAALLRARAAYLARSDTSALYFTRHSYSLSLATGRFLPLPVQDAFAETITNRDFARLTRSILRSDPGEILFEHAGPVRRRDPVGEFYRRLQTQLSGSYRPTRLHSGWELWERREPAS